MIYVFKIVWIEWKFVSKTCHMLTIMLWFTKVWLHKIYVTIALINLFDTVYMTGSKCTNKRLQSFKAKIWVNHICTFCNSYHYTYVWSISILCITENLSICNSLTIFMPAGTRIKVVFVPNIVLLFIKSLLASLWNEALFITQSESCLNPFYKLQVNNFSISLRWPL